MVCKKPFWGKGFPSPCLQCMYCRFNTRRKKTARIMLEAMAYKKSCFATFTYDERQVPLTYGGRNLRTKDAQLLIKRIRRRLPPSSLRFYLVGEYGDDTERPHYHAALFGIGVDQQALLQEAWGKGIVHVGNLEKESAQYIAGYVTKKWTRQIEKLYGRQPEFARMSNRGGGMGISALKDIGDQFGKLYGKYGLPIDVPQTIGDLPFDRYCKTKLRQFTGVSEDGKTPEVVLQALREKIKIETAEPKYVETYKQKILNFEYRHTMHAKRSKPL